MTKKSLFNRLRLGAEGNMKRRFKYTRETWARLQFIRATRHFSLNTNEYVADDGTRHIAGNLSRVSMNSDKAYLLSTLNILRDPRLTRENVLQRIHKKKINSSYIIELLYESVFHEVSVLEKKKNIDEIYSWTILMQLIIINLYEYFNVLEKKRYFARI